MNKLLSFVLFCAMAAATSASSLRAAHIEAEDQQPTEHRQLWGSGWGRPREEPDSIAEIAAGTRSLSILVKLLEAADLVDVLDGDGPFTVFAPDNRAFRALDAETVDFLTSEAGRADLEAILTYHVVAGETVRFVGRSPSTPLASLNGAPIEPSSFRTPGQWVKKVNDARIKTANINAGNGIIHIIDSVMIPPTNTTEAPVTLPTTATP